MHEHATWVGDFFQFDGSFPFQQYVHTQLHLRVIRGCEGGGGGPASVVLVGPLAVPPAS